MSKYDKAIKKHTERSEETKRHVEEMSSALSEMALDAQTTATIYEHPEIVLDDIDRRFEEATGLGKDDVAFLLFAVALQCLRQYLLTNFKERLSDKESAKKTKGHGEEHSARKRGEWYLPSCAEILANPVPYDANRHIKSSENALKGNGKLGHRLVLGHDPVLGWVFGTSNIATSTLTTREFLTYHVKTHSGNIGHGKTAKVDVISVPVDTVEMLEIAFDRFFSKGFEGVTILATSLRKEWVHLRSDINTKNSLPFPILSTISPDMANTFAEYGLDMCNIATVTKQAVYAEGINLIIAILHGMYCYYMKYPDSGANLKDQVCFTHKPECLTELELSKVKTRKILLWSNVIASGSNILAVAGLEIAKANGAPIKGGTQYIDIGGYAVTLHRLIYDTEFINQIKEEFLEKEWYNAVVGEEYSFITEGSNDE